MAFNFIKRVLGINSNLDRIVTMKVLITITENLQGKIDHSMPHIFKTIFDSLIESTEKKYPTTYQCFSCADQYVSGTTVF